MLHSLRSLPKVAKASNTSLLLSPKLLQFKGSQLYQALHRLITTSRRYSAEPFPELLSPNMITQPLPPALIARPRTKGNRHALPASWMRCGTSKGLFIDRQYLPENTESWQPWLMAAMGSKDGDSRQLDGIGGATSTTSKVAVVAPSTKPGVDLEYTFAQVAVGKEIVDYSGNCGNIASGIGPFALEQGMIDVRLGEKQVDVRILNTNTNKLLVETVALDGFGSYEDSGNYRIAGVTGTGSEVKVAFLNPAGTMTGGLFPTGNREDIIPLSDRLKGHKTEVRATLIDAGNPFVLVDSSSLPVRLDRTMSSQPDTLPLRELNDVRCQAAVMMGLAANTEQARRAPGTPKIAMIIPSAEAAHLFPENSQDISEPNVFVVSLSMGKLHPSLQLTGAVAISSALSIQDTVPHRMSRKTIRDGATTRLHGHTRSTVCIAHRSGSINVTVDARSSPSEAHIDSCSISRTARTLFEGQVLFRS